MATITILVKETLERTVTVEADNALQAIEQVQSQYDKEDIVLGSDDLTDSRITQYSSI